MVELLKNEIGTNKISEKVGDIQWLEKKIKESYKEIYETKGELQDLKKDVLKDISGKEFKTMLENELTIDHVKNVLHQAVNKFAAAKNTDKTGNQEANDHIAFMDVYSVMGAWLVFNMQLGLAKLGCTFTSGIDGMYGSKDTTLRVTEFQHAWNASHPTDTIPADGWAGEATLQKMLVALDDPKWDKSLINSKLKTETPKPEIHENPSEVKEEEVTFLSEADAMKDLAKYHLTDDGENLTPMDGYKWLDKKNPGNYATVPRKSNTDNVKPKTEIWKPENTWNIKNKKEQIITPEKQEKKEVKQEKKQVKEKETKKDTKEAIVKTPKKEIVKEKPKKIAPKPKKETLPPQPIPAPEKKDTRKTEADLIKELPTEVTYKWDVKEFSEKNAKTLVEKSNSIVSALKKDAYDFTGAKIVLWNTNEVRHGALTWYWIDMNQSTDANIQYLRSVMKKVAPTVNTPNTTPNTLPSKPHRLESPDKDSYVIEKLQWKTISWKNIFTDADMADPALAIQIAWFKKKFTKSAEWKKTGIDLDDVKIVRTNGRAMIQLDLDNDGEDAFWSTRKFNYSEVFTDVWYDATLFGKSLRNQILTDIFKKYKFNNS